MKRKTNPVEIMGTATIWNKNEEQNYGQSMETKSPAPRETTRVGEQKESPSFSWWVDQRLKRTQEYQKMKMKFQQSAISQKNEIRKRNVLEKALRITEEKRIVFKIKRVWDEKGV